MIKNNKIRLFTIIVTILFSITTFNQNSHPNIIFIMPDDHTSQAIGVYGGRLSQLDLTPNFDKIANQGIRFENTF